MVLHLQVVTLGLLLLHTGSVFSTQVSAVEGQSVTLPCTYSVSGGSVTSMCWGRGPCPRNQCSDTLIWTDGHQVSSRRNERYWLNQHIKQGDVSLTIENVTVGDRGQYCCRIEVPGWFNDIKKTISLSVVPATTTRAPRTPGVSTAPRTPGVSTAPRTPGVSTAPPTPAHTQSHKTEPSPPVPSQAGETQPTTLQETKPQPTTSSPDSGPTAGGNAMVTQSSDGPWRNNQTVFVEQVCLAACGSNLGACSKQVFEAQNPWVNTDGLYIGILVCTLVLLNILVAIAIKEYFISKKATWTLSKVLWTPSPIPALELRASAEDNTYIIEANH